MPKSKKTANKAALKSGTPRGIRIPVASVKGRCPRPLDDGGTTPLTIGERRWVGQAVGGRLWENVLGKGASPGCVAHCGDLVGGIREPSLVSLSKYLRRWGETTVDDDFNPGKVWPGVLPAQCRPMVSAGSRQKKGPWFNPRAQTNRRGKYIVLYWGESCYPLP
jgi:hypothetical protein